MKLVIGGAFQGKCNYVMKTYGIPSVDIADGCYLNSEYKYICVQNYQLFIKKTLEQNGNPIEETSKIIAENPDIIIIMSEIGNGIVPIDKSERIWREQVGQVGCFLADHAESVERIICGMCTRIK